MFMVFIFCIHIYLFAVPQEINIEHCRGKGLQANEEELPSGEAAVKEAKMEADAQIVSTLMMLGLAGTENAAKRAALAVQNANGMILSLNQKFITILDVLYFNVFVCF